MVSISANDLKTKGVAAIEAMLEQQPEAALAETRADLAAGRAQSEPPEAHLARLEKQA